MLDMNISYKNPILQETLDTICWADDHNILSKWTGKVICGRVIQRGILKTIYLEYELSLSKWILELLCRILQSIEAYLWNYI